MKYLLVTRTLTTKESYLLQPSSPVQKREGYFYDKKNNKFRMNGRNIRTCDGDFIARDRLIARVILCYIHPNVTIPNKSSYTSYIENSVSQQ